MEYHSNNDSRLYTPVNDELNRIFKIENILKDKFNNNLNNLNNINTTNNEFSNSIKVNDDQEYSNLMKVNEMKMKMKMELAYSDSALQSNNSYNMMIPLMYSEPLTQHCVDPYPTIQPLPHPNRTHSLCPSTSSVYSGRISTNQRPRQYSFVTMSHHLQPTKKRLRRSFNEIDRIYACLHPNCKKSYGTLNNLNAHIIMQNHGEKRCAADYSQFRRT